TVGLEHASRWHGADKRERTTGAAIQVLHTIEAALHVGPAEISDQPLGNVIALNCRQGGVLGCGLGAVQELKAADFKAPARAAAQIAKSDKSLLRKDHRGILRAAVGDVVRSAKPELSLGAGGHCIIRQIQEEGNGEFQLPIKKLLRLGEGDSKQITGIQVGAVTGIT